MKKFQPFDTVTITVPITLNRVELIGELEATVTTEIPAGAHVRIKEVTSAGYVMHTHCRVGTEPFPSEHLEPYEGIKVIGEYMPDGKGGVADVSYDGSGWGEDTVAAA